MNLANKITVLRMGLFILFILVLLTPYYMFGIQVQSIVIQGIPVPITNIIAAIIFIIAACTDFVDGYIARKYDMETTLGKFLDPIADKLLVNSAIIYLTVTSQIPVIFTIIFISRDIIIDALRIMAIHNNVVISASIFGKLKTVFQMIGIPILLVYSIFFTFNGYDLGNIFITIALIFSVLSGIDYFIKCRKFIFESK